MENYTTRFERVVGRKGGLEGEREEAQKQLQQWLEDPVNCLVGPHAIERNEKDTELIRCVEEAVDALISRYGGTPTPFPPNKIFLLKPGVVKEVTGGMALTGVHFLLSQDIAVERPESDVGFAVALAHELFHAKSYKAARIMPDGNPDVYRSGLRVTGKNDEQFFAELEEAIVVEMTRKFNAESIPTIPSLREEAVSIEKIKAWIRTTLKLYGAFTPAHEARINEVYSIPNIKEFIQFLDTPIDLGTASSHTLGYALGVIDRCLQRSEATIDTRSKERERLYALLGYLQEAAPARYTDAEQVFTEFARANFSGDLLSLARNIEGITEKGVFRKIAESFQEKRPSTRRTIA